MAHGFDSSDAAALADALEVECLFRRGPDATSTERLRLGALFQRQRARLESLSLVPAGRSADSRNNGSHPNTVLLDIEGATTLLPFVTTVLYPASAAALDAHVATHFEALCTPDGIVRRAAAFDPAPGDVQLRAALARFDAVKAATDGTAEQAAQEALKAAFAAHIRNLIASDSKRPYLKELQGAIWRRGYERGDIVGHVFADVAPALTRWANKDTRVPVAIYSSGSVAAQRLLFRHSSAGDLTPLLAAHFDPTTVGPKHESKSYEHVWASLSGGEALRGGAAPSPPTRCLFVSDNLAEIVAASAAGMAAVLAVRPHNAPLAAGLLSAATLPWRVAVSSSFLLLLPERPTNEDIAAEVDRLLAVSPTGSAVGKGKIVQGPPKALRSFL